MCGEHGDRLADVDPVDGIIPACAGSTSAIAYYSCPERDHPRMCGEHSVLDD